MNILPFTSHFPAHFGLFGGQFIWGRDHLAQCLLGVQCCESSTSALVSEIRKPQSGELQSKSMLLLFVIWYNTPAQPSLKQREVKGLMPLPVMGGFVCRGWELCRSNNSHSNSRCSQCRPLRAVAFPLQIYLAMDFFKNKRLNLGAFLSCHIFHPFWISSVLSIL